MTTTSNEKLIEAMRAVGFDEKLDALIERRRQMAADFLAPLPLALNSPQDSIRRLRAT